MDSTALFIRQWDFRRSSTQPQNPASFLEAPGIQAAAANQVDRHRILSLDGPGFDDAIQTDHSGATVEVARAFPALGAQLTPNIKLGADLVKARSKLAGKASESYVIKRLVHALVHVLGGRSQNIARIGATGIMVYRLGSPCWRDAGPCRLQLKTHRKKGGRT